MPLTDAQFSAMKQRYRYDPETGEFYYVCNFLGHKAGDKVLGHLRSGYVRLTFNGKFYSAHRLAFRFMLGIEPTEVDHINRVRDDNRWLNLRQVSRAENMQNKSTYRNKSGSQLAGVSFYKRTGKWKAQIQVGGKKKGLGYFRDEQDARNAYLEAKRVLHPFGYEQEAQCQQ